MIASEIELKALMKAGLGGDATGYRMLLDRLSRHLRAYYRGKLVRIGRSQTEAEDLVQDTLMAIHTRRHTYDMGQPFTPWVQAIARYKLIDHLRHTRSSMTSVPIEDAGDFEAQDDHVGAESAHDLDRLLAKLPEKMRRAIRFVKLDGLSVSEAASRCGMSESAIKVSVHRGLKAMAAVIGRERGR